MWTNVTLNFVQLQNVINVFLSLQLVIQYFLQRNQVYILKKEGLLIEMHTNVSQKKAPFVQKLSYSAVERVGGI